MKVKKDAKAKANKPKVNILRPAERDKKRYVAFEIISEKPVHPEADKEIITKANALLGVFESAKAGLMRVKYNSKNQRGLLRVDRKYVDLLRTCFVMTKELGNVTVLVRTLRVSGMLNKAAEELEKNTIQGDIKK